MTMSNQGTVRPMALGAFLTAIVLVLAGCGSDSGSSLSSSTSALERDTAQGPVKGVAVDYGVAFKGIPYAAPPVGDLRFAPPAPPAHHDEVLQADTFGGSCLQPASTFGTAESTEDCLYLNVYAPEDAANLPVMVWIHGGAFETGSGNIYDPARLVPQGIVVVTINYRLGITGFMAHPALSAGADNGASGDYGLMDQQAALRWVQDNIASFGGDKTAVTIFGESAGGLSVLSHLASPASRGLFNKAIVESGSYTAPPPTLSEAESTGESFISNNFSDCTTVDCLRSLTSEQLLAAQEASDLSFIPTLRPDVLPISVSQAISQGTFNKVPVMMGTNRDEWRLFVGIAELGRISARLKAGDTLAEAQAAAALTESQYVPAIESTLNVNQTTATGIASAYPAANYDNPSVALGAVGTDAIFACNGLDYLNQLAGQVATWGYQFSDRDAPSIIPAGNTFDLGAAHAFEIQYIFGSEADLEARGMNPDQIALANAMAGYWGRFAKSADPNTTDGTGVTWPMLSTGSQMLNFEPAGGPALMSTSAFDTQHLCTAVWRQPG